MQHLTGNAQGGRLSRAQSQWSQEISVWQNKTSATDLCCLFIFIVTFITTTIAIPMQLTVKNRAAKMVKAKWYKREHISEAYPVLMGPRSDIMLSRQHHKVDAAIVKGIPEGRVDRAAMVGCLLSGCIQIGFRHDESPCSRNTTLPARVIACDTKHHFQHETQRPN